MLKTVRTDRVACYIAAGVLLAPPVGCVLWWMALQAPRLNLDEQMLAFFGLQVPFMALSVLAVCVLYGQLYLGHVPRLAIAKTGAVALALAWPLMIPAILLHDALRLPRPMLHEAMPAPLNWWITFGLGWLLLVGACGAVALYLTPRPPVALGGRLYHDS